VNPPTPALTAQQLLDPAVLDNPNAFYTQLREEAPVWRVPGTSIVLVTSFAGVTEATNRVADFSSNLRGLIYRTEQGLPEVMPFDTAGLDTLATADPPLHSVHRGAVFPELVSRRMSSMRPDVEQLVDGHLSPGLAAGSCEFMKALGNAVPIKVVSQLIGFQEEDPQALLGAAFESTAMVGATDSLDELTARMARTFDTLGWITAQLEGTQDKSGILGVIAQCVADGEMSQMEGVVIMHTLLSAGGESTTSLLGNAVEHLARDQDLQSRIREDPSLVTPFVEEMLRLESPFRHHLRHAPQDTELLGVEIAAGSTILLMWAAANRDPLEYDRAEEVVLDRPAPRHHLGFGRGIHLCVGAPLARLEGDVVLRAMLSRTSRFALPDGHVPERVNSLMVRRFERLPLELTPA